MSTEQFLPFADLLPEPLLLVTAEGAILAANAAVQERLNLSAQDLRGRRLADVTADAADGVSLYLRACSRSKKLVLGSLRVLTQEKQEIACRCEGGVYRPSSDGTPALVLLRLIPKQAAAGQFIALNLRIEELSKEIRRRQQAEEALREQHEWLQVTLSSIGDAVIATDTQGRVTFMNPAAQSLTGWKEPEVVGRPLEEVFHIVNEETRQPVENPVARVLREDVVVGLANHTVLIARDGTETPIDDCAAPIRRGGSSMAGVVLVFHGITERRKLERALSQQNAKLIEADRRKDEFLAMLAHELRNPLAPLVNSLTILCQEKSVSPLGERSRLIMERQVKHLVRLVDDLLDVARISRGRIELRKERVELNDLIDRAVEAVAPLVASQQHDLSVSSPRGKVWLEADPARIQQVLVNLLNNACKYTPARGQIHLTVQREGNEIAVAVRDNGVGLSPEMLPLVFDLFTQAKRSLARSEGGLGIGLTMVQKLVSMHGGRTAARSDGLGKGSEFVVWLPGAEVERPQPAPMRVEPVGGKLAPQGKRLRVLIVDDNTDAAESLALLLRGFGHEVVAVVHDGHAAVGAILSQKPSVVLLDIGLPGMNGYEVAETIREQAESPPHLVAVTGYGLESDKLKSHQAGIGYHIVKPVNPERLQELLSAIADRFA